MDLRIIREHLAEAERIVAPSEKHIARQIDIIDDLTRDGHPVELALELLLTYRMIYGTHVSHRDFIREELEQ